jgi:Glycosyl hydrolase family 20, domain 2
MSQPRSMCLHLLCVLVAVVWCGGVLAAPVGTPDLVPMPKTYQSLRRTFRISGQTFFVAAKNRQCAIAVEELNLRIVKLGGKPSTHKIATDPAQPGVYILPVTHPVAKRLINAEGLDVSVHKPGPQGYIIRTTANRVIIIGSDSVGALYGAMTLRQMLVSKDGVVNIAAANIRDVPDYRYRVGVPYRRRMDRQIGAGEKEHVKAIQAALDWMLRFKINMTAKFIAYPRGLTDAKRAQIRAINKYGLERGIYAADWGDTSVANGRYDKDPEFEKWPCVFYTKGGFQKSYCWSRDDLARQKATRRADFLRDGHFKFFFLHPKDGGGIANPELWNNRCATCRKRWGDGDRWKASVHQYNLWAEVIRKRAPNVVMSSPIYPYAASFADRDRFPDAPEALWRQNSVDFWANLNRGMDRNIMPMTWMSKRSFMDEFRALWSGRATCIYAHSFVALGYFSTYHRNAKTNYYGNPDDIFLYTAGGCLTKSKWMNFLCSNEFAWNTLAPGHQDYTRVYYDAEFDHVGPKVIMDEWVPRACRAFFGKALGEKMTPVFTAGVQPFYIMNPAAGIVRANKIRRYALADVDPGKPPEEVAKAKADVVDIVDSAARMAGQVRATQIAMRSLVDAHAHVDTLDRYQKKIFYYYYRRMPFWYLAARAHHAERQAAELQRQGMYAQSVSVLKTGLALLDKDLAYLQSVLAATKGKPDLTTIPLLSRRNRDRVENPQPGKLRQLLQERLASASVVLKPRRPGPKVRVAIFTGLGAQGTKAFFDTFKNVDAEIIDSLSLAVLDRFDCVFIMQTKRVDRGDVFHGLRRYVIEGGRGVVFQHDMCGRPGRSAFGAKTPFPEICSHAPGRKDALKVLAKVAHPVLTGAKPNDAFKHMYYDHLNPKPGPEGKVVVVDEEGDPVVIVGSVGLGKVIFDGNVNLTSNNEDKPLVQFNAMLAKGAVEWFTGVKLLKK